MGPEPPSTGASSEHTGAAMESLPNELLTQVFGYLDAPPPSTSTLRDEPTFLLTKSNDTYLKACSCVSRRWRQAILPLLFKHARFILAEPKTINPNLSKQIQPFFNFLSTNTLREIVTSLTLVIHDKKIAQPNGISVFWDYVFRNVEPDLTIVAPPEALGTLTTAYVELEDIWSFDCPCQYLHLRQPRTSRKISSAYEAPSSIPASDAMTFQFSDPVALEGFLPSASAETNSLLDPSVPSFLQQLPGHNAAIQDAPIESTRRYGCKKPPTLFEYRPWTTLLLNEGSFLRAYATYEYWLRRPPSILADLVGASPHNKHLITPTIRDMSYVAMFPFSAHYRILAEHFPRLDRIYTQIVPRNDIWKDHQRMKNIESEDLWCERNSCYSAIMRGLFSAPPAHNYRNLLMFESGDAADEDAWAMAVEYMKRANNGWLVESEGVFVRDPEGIRTKPIGETHSVFDGALVRWAFNGITKLPVSAYPLYE